MSEICMGKAIVIQGKYTNVDTAMGWYTGMDGLPPAEIASKFMSGTDPKIAKEAASGDILVGGRCFGYGKAHPSFFAALDYIGIKCICAESFSTQLVQGALGAYGGSRKAPYLVECPDILDQIEMGDEIRVDYKTAVIENITKGTVIQGKPFPEFCLHLMEIGGQMEFVKERVSEKK